MNTNFQVLREKMVGDQIASRGIANLDVRRAFLEVPREKFVPENMRNLAYEDHPLSIGFGQTISQPYMVALMTEVLGPKQGEKILEIGTGSGYQAAILSCLGAKVYSVERLGQLATRAKEILEALGYSVEIKVSDGTLGWEDEAPFSAIIVTAASYKVPLPLLEQLGCGGRMVIPLGGELSQVLTLVKKDSSGNLSQEKVCGCVFVPLIGEHGFKQGTQ
jgi:protein-L-isoaspartate(D-aspartate) O-methyltransferase